MFYWILALVVKLIKYICFIFIHIILLFHFLCLYCCHIPRSHEAMAPDKIENKEGGGFSFVYVQVFWVQNVR